jgi:glycosyltransferase involved in cell wall biosynthesis
MHSSIDQFELKVSVIIPTYNRAGYLREALESVFKQSSAPWEVIVVDDGSTDETRQVVENAPGTVRYLEQEHRGVAAARNLGLDSATGDVIAWLDSDDIWDPDFLATVVPLLVQNDGLDGVYSGITMIDANGKALRTVVRVEPPEQLHKALSHSNFLATPSVVVRKRCYDCVGSFDEELRIAEDADMWLRLSRQFRLEGLAQSLVRIRVHDSNLMSDAEAFREAQLRYAQKRIVELEGDRSELSDSARAIRGLAYRTIALMYIQSGQDQKGWDYLFEAVSVYPQILSQLETFYELACGDQPRGYRGDVNLLDIERNGAKMLHQLEALFREASSDVHAFRSVAFGNAYLALGMLSDQANHWSRARHYLFQAFRNNPKLIVCPQVFWRWLKVTFLTPKLLATIKPHRRGQ